MQTSKLRVLVAEREPYDAAGALRSLYPDADKRFELSAVATIGTLLPTIAIVNPDVLILNLNLTDTDPAETVRHVHRAAPRVPILLFADLDCKEDVCRCLAHGALNWLCKSKLDRAVLDWLLGSAIERNTLGGLADLLRDPLTGLYQRDALLALGTQAIDQARRMAGRVVLYCGVLENWSQLREELGSAAADNLLRDCSALLQGSFRRTDYVARIGNAQFAALAVDAAEPSAAVLQQRVQRRLDIFNSVRPADERVQLRGYALFWTSGDLRGFPELLEHCETGLRRHPLERGEATSQAAGVPAQAPR